MEDQAHIGLFTTSKEIWDHLTDLYIGNKSIKHSKFDSLTNDVDGFIMKEGETPQELYRRLKVLFVALTGLGSKDCNDAWIKRKFMYAIMPFEPKTINIVRSRPDYYKLTSNDVLSEYVSLSIMEMNSKTNLARNQGIQGTNLALKAKSSIEDEDEE